jgi:hypothetical protein
LYSPERRIAKSASQKPITTKHTRDHEGKLRKIRLQL